MAYFYFDFRDSSKQNRRDLLPSLVTQLSARSNPYCDILFRLYLAHDRGASKPSEDDLIKCLKEMVTLPDQPPIFLIVDALDECPNSSGMPSPREQVIDPATNGFGLLPNSPPALTPASATPIPTTPPPISSPTSAPPSAPAWSPSPRPLGPSTISSPTLRPTTTLPGDNVPVASRLGARQSRPITSRPCFLHAGKTPLPQGSPSLTPRSRSSGSK